MKREDQTILLSQTFYICTAILVIYTM